MADPSALAGLPPSLQTAVTVAVGAATFIAATVTYLRQKKILPPAHPVGSGSVEATIVAGAIGGADQMRVLLEVVKRIEAHIETGNKVFDDFGEAQDRTASAVGRLEHAYDRVEKAVRADTEEHSRNSRDLANAIHALAIAINRRPG